VHRPKPTSVTRSNLDARSLQEALSRFAAHGETEIYEHGKFLPRLVGFQLDVTEQAGRILLHLWSDEANLVRQVTALLEENESRLLLEVRQFGKKQPFRMEWLRKDAPRAPERLTREKFRARLAQILEEQFPDEKVESLTAAPDLEHSFSGNFTRGVMSRGGQEWALVAAAPGELPATVDGALTFGLLWLDWVRLQASRRVVAGLRLLLPEGGTATAAFRLPALDRSIPIELFSYEETTWHIRRVPISDGGNIATWMTPLHEVQRTLDAAHGEIARWLALAPEAIDCIVPPGTKEVAVRFRGLEFARWKNGAMVFGLEGSRESLTPAKWPKLKKLVQKLETHRHPQAKDTAHPLYRAQAERWLETILLHDPARMDAHLDSKFLYSQVPAFSSKDRGVLDLLGRTRDGRLVIIELKASQDLHLPLQAVDYWQRVRTHQLAEDFQRYGYFGGAELQAAPPRLYLVAPGFQFHPSTDTVLRYISKEIEVTRIGLNENWRRGVQVIFRM